MKRDYTHKAKSERGPVGSISIEAKRLAAAICVHPCEPCQAEAQATLNNLAATRDKETP